MKRRTLARDLDRLFDRYPLPIALAAALLALYVPTLIGPS